MDSSRYSDVTERDKARGSRVVYINSFISFMFEVKGVRVSRAIVVVNDQQSVSYLSNLTIYYIAI